MKNYTRCPFRRLFYMQRSIHNNAGVASSYLILAIPLTLSDPQWDSFLVRYAPSATDYLGLP